MTEQPIGKQHDDDMLMNSTPTLLEEKKRRAKQVKQSKQNYMFGNPAKKKI